MEDELVVKIMELYESSLEWDYDGSHWLSPENHDARMIDFKEELLEILKTSKL